ncbi:MAG: HD domain-containing phosphohydrolase [Acidimicrobiia bacterium]
MALPTSSLHERTTTTAPPVPNRHSIVLIIDDSPESIAAAADVLSGGNLRIRAAVTGARGLELAASDPQPDLILLDVLLPDHHGFEVLEALSANPRTRHIPVIFLTAAGSPEAEEEGLRRGAVDYITKPFRPAIMLARVGNQIELKQAREKLAMHNHHLEAEVARRLRENQLVQDVTIHVLARLAETRDNETGNHLLRTQEYVRIMAMELAKSPRYSPHLTPRSIEVLSKSAQLHDIGKVGIPDAILLKPGALTAEERVIMQTHAALGSQAIEQAERDIAHPLEFLRFAKEIAHHHHEKWDGTGYPDGLRGEEIPLSARLMALADVFDALVSKRVYKMAFPLEDAYELIVSERGKHFDPDVVDAFVAHFAHMSKIATHLDDVPGS